MEKFNKISLCEPKIYGKEWTYIKECLDTNWVSSSGKYIQRFEDFLSSYLDRKYAVACINGTSALHVALLVAGIKPEDEVLLPTITFIAPANAVRYTGAWPVFIDVEPSTWQMDTQKVKDFLRKECRVEDGQVVNRHTGRKIKAILPVHILGYPVDMDPIIELARKFELTVIGDASESLGAVYKGRKVGALSDISCLSFNGNKIITAGGGGMIITDNQEWADKARYLINQAKDDAQEYIHHEIGYNYRLTNLCAAVGLAQAEKLEEYVEDKKRIAFRYNEEFKAVSGISFIRQREEVSPSFWLYTIRINAQEYGVDSRFLLEELCRQGIETRPLWHPLYSLKPFEDAYAYKIEEADSLYQQALSLPCSVGLNHTDQDRVIQAIKEKANILLRR